MVTVPLYLFLALYLAVVATVSVMLFFAGYHLLRFGYVDSETIGSAILFLVLLALICVTTFFFVSGVDWRQELELALPFVAS